MTDLPEPLVSADCDLSGMPFMPLDVQRLLDSELWITGTGDECKAAVSLWCKAWMQRPAASLPDDDRLLADYSKAGAKWKKVKAKALHGFVKCSDGRLYHAVVAEKARDAWGERQAYRGRLERARAAKQAKVAAAIEPVKGSVTTPIKEPVKDAAIEPVTASIIETVIAPVTGLKGQRQETETETGTAPLPPADRRSPAGNGHARPKLDDAVEVVKSYYLIRSNLWGSDPPTEPPPRDVSIARGWIDRGGTWERIVGAMERRMQRMLDAGELPPGDGFKFFNAFLPRDLGLGGAN